MTDDTLREECEALIDDLRPCIETEGSYYIEPTRALNIALAFARAQQAKGLREAAEKSKAFTRWCESGEKKRVCLSIAQELEAQATAREQGHGA